MIKDVRPLTVSNVSAYATQRNIVLGGGVPEKLASLLTEGSHKFAD